MSGHTCPHCQGVGYADLALDAVCADCGCQLGVHSARDARCAVPERGGGYRLKARGRFRLAEPNEKPRGTP